MSLENELSTGVAPPVYNVLVLLAFQALALVALVDYQRTERGRKRGVLIALWGLVGARLILLVGQLTNGPLLAPLLNGLVSITYLLLGWLTLSKSLFPLLRKLYLFAGLALVTGATIAFSPIWLRVWGERPGLSYAGFWQQPIWAGLQAVLILAPTFSLAQSREEMDNLSILFAFLAFLVNAAFFILGSTFLALGSIGGQLPYLLIGIGRLSALGGFGIVTVNACDRTLQDAQEYRQELQTMSEQTLHLTQGLHVLVEVSHIIGGATDLSTVLDRIVESVALALEADRCAIFLLGVDDPKHVRLAANYVPLQPSQSEGPLTLSLDSQPTLNYVMHRGKRLTLNGGGEHPRLRQLYEILGSDQAGPTVVLPILHDQAALGALVVGNDRSQRPFDKEQIQICESVAAQITAALENTRVCRELRTEAGELAATIHSREEDLRQKDAVLESLSAGLIIGDPQGRITSVNSATEQILGIPRRRIIGQSLRHLSHPRDDAQSEFGWAAAEVERAERLGFNGKGERTHRIIELEEKIIAVDTAPILSPAGDRLGVVALLQNVTERVEAERAKDEFIIAISHELRTPLTAIRGYAEALSNGMIGEVTEAQSHFLNVIRDNALHMVSFADNLIAIAQIEKGYLKLEYGETDLTLIVGEVLRTFESQLEARQLNAKLEIQKDLPVIEADPARVRQILENLVSNAIKFTYPGGKITIGARLLENNGSAHCSIWVTDTGIGIPPEEQAHIWDRFYRPKNPLAAEASGLGVGLSIVKSLVQAHGGRIWLESKQGEGSTFTVLLPTERSERSTLQTDLNRSTG